MCQLIARRMGRLHGEESDGVDRPPGQFGWIEGLARRCVRATGRGPVAHLGPARAEHLLVKPSIAGHSEVCRSISRPRRGRADSPSMVRHEVWILPSARQSMSAQGAFAWRRLRSAASVAALRGREQSGPWRDRPRTMTSAADHVGEWNGGLISTAAWNIHRTL
jgi:hypothetical protein